MCVLESVVISQDCLCVCDVRACMRKCERGVCVRAYVYDVRACMGKCERVCVLVSAGIYLGDVSARVRKHGADVIHDVEAALLCEY